MTKTLAGVLAPVITPFDNRTGEMAADSFRANVRAHVDAGLAGIVVSGSTGEAPLLDEDERRKLVEWARPLVSADGWLVAGIGAEATRDCLRRSRDAAGAGADAVLVVAPHYYGSAMTREALRGHFRRVADASPIPAILYNIPKYTHFTLEPDLVSELSAHGNIAGIKDSSGELKVLEAYLHAQTEQFAVLTGHGGSLHDALRVGARGAILAVALFADQLVAGVTAAFARGDSSMAAGYQERLVPLAKEIVARMGVAGVKAAMDMVGLQGGMVREPLLQLTMRERDEVASLLRDASLLHAA